MLTFNLFVKNLEAKFIECNVTYCYSRSAMNPLKREFLYIVIPESVDREKNINKLKSFLAEYEYSWYISKMLNRDLSIVDKNLVYSYKNGMNISFMEIDPTADPKEISTVLEYAAQKGATVYFTVNK